MSLHLGLLPPLFVLGAVAAGIALVYFLVRGLQQDHETEEYHFTWGVGIVGLFLLGLAPGVVGLGLYLTVEKGYPFYWLVLCLFVVFGIGTLGLAAVTTVTTAAVPVVFG